MTSSQNAYTPPHPSPLTTSPGINITISSPRKRHEMSQNSQNVDVPVESPQKHESSALSGENDDFHAKTHAQFTHLHSLLITHESQYKSLFDMHEKMRIKVYDALEREGSDALRELREFMRQRNVDSAAPASPARFLHDIEENRMQREVQMREGLAEMGKEQRQLRRLVSTLELEKSQVERELLQSRSQLQSMFAELRKAREDVEHWKMVLQKKIKKLKTKKKKKAKKSTDGKTKQVSLSELEQLKLQLQMQQETHASEMQSLKERYHRRLEKHKTEINSLRLSLMREFHDSHTSLQKKLEEQHNKELKSREQLLAKRLHNMKDVYEQKLQHLTSELQQLKREHHERSVSATATAASKAPQEQQVEILVSPLAASRKKKSPQKSVSATKTKPIDSPQLPTPSNALNLSPPSSPKFEMPTHSIVLHGLTREQKSELEEKISVLKFKFAKALEQQQEQYKALRDKYKSFRRVHEKADYQNNERIKYVRESMKKYYEDEIYRLKEELQSYYESMLYDDHHRYEGEVAELKQELRKLLLETEKVKAEYKFQSMIQEQQLRRRNLQIMRSHKLTSKYLNESNSAMNNSALGASISAALFSGSGNRSAFGSFMRDLEGEEILDDDEEPKVEYETVNLGAFGARGPVSAERQQDASDESASGTSSTAAHMEESMNGDTPAWIHSWIENTRETREEPGIGDERAAYGEVLDGSSFLVDSDDETHDAPQTPTPHFQNPLEEIIKSLESMPDDEADAQDANVEVEVRTTIDVDASAETELQSPTTSTFEV